MDKSTSDLKTIGSENNDPRIRKLYHLDIFLLVIFTAATWLTVVFIDFSITAIADTAAEANFISILCFVILMVLSLSMYMVKVHLQRNRQEIYSEEIFWLDQNSKDAVTTKK